MDWIQAHIVELLAVVGGLYTAARIIVSLTPTPKDDKALAKVSSFVKTVAKLAGLDLKQGRQMKDDGSGGSTSGASVASCIIVGASIYFLMFGQGCATVKDPRATLVAGQKVFASTVDSLTIAIKAGKFSDEEVLKISELVHQGQEVLTQWQEVVQANGDAASYADVFNKVLDGLLEYNQKIGKE